MQLYDERLEELRNWILTQEVQQGFKLIVLVLGALALKFGTETWKWAYLITSSMIAITWFALLMYRIFAKAVEKKIKR